VNDDRETYCRSVEAHLCRKNDGHLIRIVGPAFEQVCGWAARGIPLKIVFRGIDRYFERYYAKGPRRRPIRLEFCEADILDVFDEWRRAVGVAAVVESEDQPVEARKRGSLTTHLERVVARLTALRAGEERSLDGTLDDIVRELDAARASSKGLRGEARDALLQRLRILDDQLLQAARTDCDTATLGGLAAEADKELAPFRHRMPADAFAQSQQACIDRLIRERARLPTIAFD
jgi:hypothetical protein